MEGRFDGRKFTVFFRIFADLKMPWTTVPTGEAFAAVNKSAKKPRMNITKSGNVEKEGSAFSARQVALEWATRVKGGDHVNHVVIP